MVVYRTYSLTDSELEWPKPWSTRLRIKRSPLLADALRSLSLWESKGALHR